MQPEILEVVATVDEHGPTLNVYEHGPGPTRTALRLSAYTWAGINTGLRDEFLEAEARYLGCVCVFQERQP